MPRKAREESETKVYHVSDRGINKLTIFGSKYEKEQMLSFIRENIQKYEVEIYAYCIMSTHFHLLIKSELKELSKFMAMVLAAYAQYYNYKEGRTGYVFQGRFDSECIETESYFWNCLRYIHLNPVKARITKSVKNYKYSSWHEYSSRENDILHPKAFLMYQTRFNSSKEFSVFHKQPEKNIFHDVKEDQNIQKKEVAKYLLKEMAGNLNCIEQNILAIGDNRTAFRTELKETLELSEEEQSQMIEYLRGVLKDGSN